MRQPTGLQQHGPRWQAAATAAGVVIAAAAAAAAPVALAAATDAVRRRSQTARTARTGLQQTVGTNRATLPLAGHADLEARVHPAVVAIPYISRDDEQTIRDFLTAGRPVLLVGSSMVGKTKMAAQVITKSFGSWPTVIPDSKTALADLDAHDISINESVVWLDDLDRLIGADGITDEALRRLVAAGNVLIATIRVAEYDRFQPTDKFRPPEWT